MEQNTRTVRLLPALFAVGLVPLIVTAKKYNLGLGAYSWFPNRSSWTDLFLYWKGQALIFLAFVMVAVTLFLLTEQKEYQPEWKKIKIPEMGCLAIYLMIALVSSILSKHAGVWFGNYEQWEGFFVLLAYGILLTFVYLMVETEKLIRFFVYAILAGSFVVGLIGTFQYLGMDFFRSSMGQAVMNLLSAEKMEFTFNFSDGWVYTTLYNPNYVGSFAALVLPIHIAVSMIEWKKIPVFWSVISMAGTCLMVVTLLGSQSLTGCVGIVASLLFVLIYRFPLLLDSMGKKKMVIRAACVAAFVVLCCIMFPEPIQSGMDKLFHPKKDTHVLKELLSTERGLSITTVKGDTMYLTVSTETNGEMAAADEQGQSVLLKADTEKQCYMPEDERFADFRFYPMQIKSEEETIPAVRLVTASTGKEWNVARRGTQYQVYSVYGKFDTLRHIPAWGFEDCQHFGDKRGYIWSRTFPLLKNCMIVGAGPDSFTEIFPNDDYVGKNNMNYNGVTVTKPHNLYLQIWSQTGFLSLLAFLGLFLLYFVKSVRLFWKRRLQTVTEKVGMAVMVSLLGYMITGIANDSTVAVAPVFWGMLGLGMAVNRMLSRQKETKDRKEKRV